MLELDSTLRHNSTASTEKLDSPRQPSTATRRAGAWSQPRQARQELDRLDKARQARPRQRPRQRLDGASTARQLDSQGSILAVRFGKLTDKIQISNSESKVCQQLSILFTLLDFIRSLSCASSNGQGLRERPTGYTAVNKLPWQSSNRLITCIAPVFDSVLVSCCLRL